MQHHKILTTLALLVLLAAGMLLWRMRGPHRGYELDFVLPAEAAAPGVLEAGAAVRNITPELAAAGSRTVWLGGFGPDRPATGIHDDLWARAIALRNNGVTVALVTVDSVGLFHNTVIDVRQAVDPALGIDHIVVSSTHTHHAPDTMGIWSGRPVLGNFDDAYLARVAQACAEATEEAVRALQPAVMTAATTDLGPEGFLRDSRPPICYDRQLHALRFAAAGTGETIATVVSWANHPEAAGARNTLVSSGFPHALRTAMEQGLPEPNGMAGFGGVCLYFQGPLGGLMTPLGVAVPRRDGSGVIEEDSYEKAMALGENVALAAAQALRGPGAWSEDRPALSIAAKTYLSPVRGLFRYAMMLGLIHPGYYWGGRSKTEVNVIRLGDVEMLTCPGELYPEIVEGSVESPDGADHPIEPIESPGLRSLMQGRMKMVIGLANDEIGYILPKSQWDTEPPHTYGSGDGHYGEENSCGPDTGPAFYREAAALLQRLHGRS